MDSIKDLKVISALIIVALICFGLALQTVDNTFAFDSIDEKANWDVYLGDAIIKNNRNGDVTINNNVIDFSVNLNDFGDEFGFITTVYNDGTFDAFLQKINYTDLNTMVVGTSSETGKTYTVKDYVSFQVLNAYNNKENDIIVNTHVKVRDLLQKGTKNDILVRVQYRNKERLNEDQLRVLEEYGKTFNLDLSINVLYQQKN